MKLIHQTSLQTQQNRIILLNTPQAITQFDLPSDAQSYLQAKLSDKATVVALNLYTHQLFFVYLADKPQNYYLSEKARSLGYEVYQLLKKEKIYNIQVQSLENEGFTLNFLEGLYLSSYQFLKYKTEKDEGQTLEVQVHAAGIAQTQLTELAQLCQAVFEVRDLVNEPVLYLTAEKFSEEIQRMGNEAGFSVEVLHKNKIEALGMTGLLTVNKGSIDPPTFNILEYKPANAQNTQPFVLVGKGVVYDTGGLSLKPTPDGMDYMKCDMAGAGAVVGAMYAVAKNNLPLYVIGLIPATDNRPGGNAITPGDIIKMMNGKTVEIRNTDAEGRLILADALCYASRYQPQLTIDLATLTGSAARAIGYEGAVLVGNADEISKNKLKKAGEAVFERLAELPFWDEYEEHIKSDIADINNLGRAEAGAITAGRFLQHFTDYPWLHIDLAAPAFLKSPDKYRSKGGTAYGVRLLYQFLKNQIQDL
ncbi:MAG: leucyl aminopeptidase [Microscillaceae bacterium]|jgi:leucyl aminopeptidase|nr:leucyl aminopeptidase [Microscillaceae bacterium]